MSAGVDIDRVAAAATIRRDLHKHAESGWTEFRTAATIVRHLRDAGFDVAAGRAVVSDDRPGLPGPEVLDAELRRAVAQGADPAILADLAGGYTGVVGTLRGRAPGPTVALRFDIDANTGDESTDVDFRPAREGFVSINAGANHNCGHDAHTTVGLTLAAELGRLAELVRGEIRLVFQPAEEGLRGGRPMVEAGVVDGVELLLGCHVGVQARTTGEVIAGYRRILASHKFDAVFTGRNAHAGISPHEGRNALLAAVVATQNLAAISRHGEGDTRVNVGTLVGGEARNTIPAHATLRGEVRASTSAVLDFMVARTARVLEAAAEMYEVDVSIGFAGGARAADSDDALTDVVHRVASRLPSVTAVRRTAEFAASDDVSEFMARVQAQGGRAVYFGVGAELTDLHHTPRFDLDEAAMPIAVDLFLGCLREIGALDGP